MKRLISQCFLLFFCASGMLNAGQREVVSREMTGYDNNGNQVKIPLLPGYNSAYDIKALESGEIALKPYMIDWAKIYKGSLVDQYLAHQGIVRSLLDAPYLNMTQEEKSQEILEVYPGTAEQKAKEARTAQAAKVVQFNQLRTRANQSWAEWFKSWFK